MHPTLRALALFAGLTPLVVQAVEYPIGKPEQRAGMEIAAVYLQPIRMEPEGMMRPAEHSDVHLEADIRATEDNKNGFAEGEWLPYLKVEFELRKASGEQVASGEFMPMVANDGPHYGDNVKLAGYGKYHLKYVIHAPGAAHGSHFGRHTDKLTGVAPWFEPITLEWDFVYSGIGKKGGY